MYNVLLSVLSNVFRRLLTSNHAPLQSSTDTGVALDRSARVDAAVGLASEQLLSEDLVFMTEEAEGCAPLLLGA